MQHQDCGDYRELQLNRKYTDRMKNRITVKRHRKSIRLKGYDYTREGLYFITICTKNRQPLVVTIPGSVSVIINQYK